MDDFGSFLVFFFLLCKLGLFLSEKSLSGLKSVPFLGEKDSVGLESRFLAMKFVFRSGDADFEVIHVGSVYGMSVCEIVDLGILTLLTRIETRMSSLQI